MNMKIMVSYMVRHWKYAEKQKSYVSDMKWMTDENYLWDEKKPNARSGRLRRKGVMEEKGLSFLS